MTRHLPGPDAPSSRRLPSLLTSTVVARSAQTKQSPVPGAFPAAAAPGRAADAPGRDSPKLAIMTLHTDPTAPAPVPAAASVFRLDEATAVLARTPGTLRALLAGLPAGWHQADEGADTWPPLAVVGHLIHSDETVWLVRADTIRRHGESQAFPPGDQQAQFTRFAGWSMDDLLDRFTATRNAALATVAGWQLTERDLELRGRHTHFGVVTLANLLATWVVHDLTHLTQVARVMAKRYAGDVGAWRDQLTIYAPR
jgi:hypothetical protein